MSVSWPGLTGHPGPLDLSRVCGEKIGARGPSRRVLPPTTDKRAQPSRLPSPHRACQGLGPFSVLHLGIPSLPLEMPAGGAAQSPPHPLSGSHLYLVAHASWCCGSWSLSASSMVGRRRPPRSGEDLGCRASRQTAALISSAPGLLRVRASQGPRRRALVFLSSPQGLCLPWQAPPPLPPAVYCRVPETRG